MADRNHAEVRGDYYFAARQTPSYVSEQYSAKIYDLNNKTNESKRNSLYSNTVEVCFYFCNYYNNVKYFLIKQLFCTNLI